MPLNPTPQDGPGKPLDQAMRGEIPWDIAGFNETMETLGLTLERPKDDWNYDVPKTTVVVDGQGYRFNPLHPGNQLLALLRQRYPDKATAMAHMWRFWAIQDFIHDHQDELEHRGLMEVDHGEPTDVHDAVIIVLCRSPMLDVRGSLKPDDEGSATYFPESVIDEAVLQAHDMGDFGPD